MDSEDAVRRVSAEDFNEAFDKWAIEEQEARDVHHEETYAALADAYADAIARDAGRGESGDNGRAVQPGVEGEGRAGAEEYRGRDEDEREAQGLNGPPPLDPEATGIDDGTGPDAKTIVDSLEHDVRAEVQSEQNTVAMRDEAASPAPVEHRGDHVAKSDGESAGGGSTGFVREGENGPAGVEETRAGFDAGAAVDPAIAERQRQQEGTIDLVSEF